MDHKLIERHQDNHLTAYTAIQIYMAIDEWFEARKSFDDALDQYSEKVVEPIGITDTIDLIGYARMHPEFDSSEKAIMTICDFAPSICPLGHKLLRHSHEVYPVEKTLREAAKLRNSAKKIHALIGGYNA